MKILKVNLLVGVVALLLASSCSAPKKVPYFADAETLSTEVLSQLPVNSDPVINVGDLLNIEVTGTNVNALAPFNKGRYIDATGNIGTVARPYNSYSNTGVEMSTDYYLVNSDGAIDFPIIGKIEVAGLPKSKVAEKIAADIYPKYVTEKPNVDIRLMNFRVTVAVTGVQTCALPILTFLEAISMAGDLLIQGDRENILLYRSNPDGTREVVKLNIHDKDFLLSPYFTLQQNDFIYVEPNASMRAGAWQMNSGLSATISIVGGLSSLASLVVGVINLSR